MGKQVGGRGIVGFIKKDHKIYLSFKWKKSLQCEEVKSLLSYIKRQIIGNFAFVYNL